LRGVQKTKVFVLPFTFESLLMCTMAVTKLSHLKVYKKEGTCDVCGMDLEEREEELKNISTELAIGLSESFEGLKKISSGDPTIRISETSKVELINKLKHLVNVTAEEIGEIVNQSHEMAIGLTEHFDVLNKVTQGDLKARASGRSKDELLKSLKKVKKEYILKIAGKGYMKKKLEKYVTKNKLNVEFLGHIPKEKLSSLYNSSNFIVMPSVFEPFGFFSFIKYLIFNLYNRIRIKLFR